MDPSTADEWMAVADARGSDAAAMLPAREGSVGPVYMAGYAIECSIKAYRTVLGVGPVRGKEGHNLRELWKSIDRHSFRDLDLLTQERSFFFEYWSTELRYCSEYEGGHGAMKLVQAAKSIAGWIQTQARRQADRRRGKRR